MYENLRFHAQLSWAWKKFYNLGAWLFTICNSTWGGMADSVDPDQIAFFVCAGTAQNNLSL